MTRTLAALLGTAYRRLDADRGAGAGAELVFSRHYDTDERLYSDFTAATGITGQPHRGQCDELIARMEGEGERQPGRRFPDRRHRGWRRDRDGAAAADRERRLEARIRAYLQDEGNHWFALVSQRAGILFYGQNRRGEPALTYQILANPEYEGMSCIRSSTNVYTQKNRRGR